MRLEQLRNAYKIAENISVDYFGMSPAEIKEFDDALDIVLKLAKTAIERAEAEAEETSKLNKIKEITARALRSSDPINLYKARALDDIAEILGIEIREPEAEEADSKDQITIDDIIKEV